MLEDLGSPEALVANTQVLPAQLRLAVAYRDSYPGEIAEAIVDNRRPISDVAVLVNGSFARGTIWRIFHNVMREDPRAGVASYGRLAGHERNRIELSSSDGGDRGRPWRSGRHARMP